MRKGKIQIIPSGTAKTIIDYNLMWKLYLQLYQHLPPSVITSNSDG